MLGISDEIIAEESIEHVEGIDKSLIDYFNTFLETYLSLKEE